MLRQAWTVGAQKVPKLLRKSKGQQKSRRNWRTVQQKSDWLLYVSWPYIDFRRTQNPSFFGRSPWESDASENRLSFLSRRRNTRKLKVFGCCRRRPPRAVTSEPSLRSASSYVLPFFVFFFFSFSLLLPFLPSFFPSLFLSLPSPFLTFACRRCTKEKTNAQGCAPCCTFLNQCHQEKKDWRCGH